MFYIEENDKIVLFDENKAKLIDTIKFMPQYKHLEIQETERPIIDYEFADTDEYYEKIRKKELENKKQEILNDLDELDKKRIRAVCENEIKDKDSGQTWLEYYNDEVIRLREELKSL